MFITKTNGSVLFIKRNWFIRTFCSISRSSNSSSTPPPKENKHQNLFNCKLSRKFSRFSANNIMTGSDTFKISDYDCIGFDLDNTLLRYKLTAMVDLEYKCLVKYLIEHKGYSGKYLLEPLQIDFLQKGLIIDFSRGNILKINADAFIERATHGTRFLSDAEIVKYYGEERKWSELVDFTKDLLIAWNGPAAEKLRTLLDYFDMPTSLVFARIVDTLDEEVGGEKLVSYNIWPDILDGLLHMYTREHFSTNKSEYFSALKKTPSNYMHRTPESVIKFVKKLKQTKTTFLLTGSHIDFANLTASYALGNDWKNLFDVVVCFAKKPGFFNGERPFIQLKGATETTAINQKDLQLNHVYSQGNLPDLLQLLAKKSPSNSKLLYFGDNLIQDVYAPATFAKSDTVAIVEELLAEGIRNNDKVIHEDMAMITSNLWGSYFGQYDQPSLWTEVIRNYSKICVPSMDVIAAHPIDHSYVCFKDYRGNGCGFYPNEPISFRDYKQ